MEGELSLCIRACLFVCLFVWVGGVGFIRILFAVSVQRVGTIFRVLHNLLHGHFFGMADRPKYWLTSQHDHNKRPVFTSGAKSKHLRGLDGPGVPKTKRVSVGVSGVSGVSGVGGVGGVDGSLDETSTRRRLNEHRSASGR